MALRKPSRAAHEAHAKRTAQALAKHIEYLRKLTPPRGTRFYVLAGELAAETGAEVADIIEHFDERASVREYLGGVTRAESERLAWGDVLEHYRRLAALAV